MMRTSRLRTTPAANPFPGPPPCAKQPPECAVRLHGRLNSFYFPIIGNSFQNNFIIFPNAHHRLSPFCAKKPANWPVSPAKSRIFRLRWREKTRKKTAMSARLSYGRRCRLSCRFSPHLPIRNPAGPVGRVEKTVPIFLIHRSGYTIMDIHLSYMDYIDNRGILQQGRAIIRSHWP